MSDKPGIPTRDQVWKSLRGVALVFLAWFLFFLAVLAGGKPG